MGNPFTIEDIEAKRREEGIDDIELREQIRRLAVGDFVRLTLLTGTQELVGEPLLVRITSIKGHRFRGKVTGGSAVAGSSKPSNGTLVAFTTAHIHSVRRQQQPAAAPPTNGTGRKKSSPARVAKSASLTTQERLQRIEAMGLRIEGYVRFICEVGQMIGTCGDDKDNAVAAFYERMLVLESELARIEEDLRLG